MRQYFQDAQLGHGSNNPFLPYWGGGLNRSITQDALRLEKGATSGKSINIYLDLLTDSFANSCFNKQISEICTKGNLIKPGDDRANSKLAAEDCKLMLESLGKSSASNNGTLILDQGLTLEGLIAHLAVSAITGISTVEIVWEKQRLPSIKRVVPVDPRTVVMWKDEWGNVYPKLLTREEPQDGIFLPARQFIISRFWSIPSADPWGLGLGRQLYYPVTWKRSILTFWLMMADKASDPQLIVTYPDGTAEADREKVMASLLKFGREAGVAVPSGWSVEIANRNVAGSTDFLQNLIKYCDDQIAMAILGTSTSGTETGGGINRETINNSLRIQIAKQLADGITSSLSNTLLKWYTEARYGNTAAVPIFYKNFVDEEDMLDMAEKAQRLGYTLDIGELESSLNIKLSKREKPKAALPA